MFLFHRNIAEPEKLYESGKEKMLHGQNVEAINDFTAAYTADNKMFNALYLRAICMTAVMRFADALESMQQFIKLSKPNEFTEDAIAVEDELKRYLESSADKSMNGPSVA